MKKAKVSFVSRMWVLFEDSVEGPIIAQGSAMDIILEANKLKISIVNRTTLNPSFQEQLWDSIEGYLVRNDFNFVTIHDGTKSYYKGNFAIGIHESPNKEGNSIVLVDPNGEKTYIPNDFYTLVGLLHVNNLDK